MKPRVEIIGLGGTVASRPRPGAAGVFPDLSADDLVEGLIPAGERFGNYANLAWREAA